MNIRDNLTPTQELTVLRNELDLENLLSVYPTEALDKLIQHKDRLQQLSKSFTNINDGISKASLIMRCNVAACPFKQSCVLLKNGIAPNGYQCPIEKKLVMEIEASIIETLDIDRQDTIEMELLYDFIDAKLLDMRTSGMLAEGSVVQIIEIDNGKATNKYKDIAPEFKVKMDLKKLKSNIMEEFMATRKAKKRYGLNGDSSTFEDIIKNAMGTKDKE